MNFEPKFDNIYMNTRGRIDNQAGLKLYPDFFKMNVKAVVREDEYDEFYTVHKDNFRDIISHPNPLDNISKIRQWMIDTFEEERIIIMDDNICFYMWDVKNNEKKAYTIIPKWYSREEIYNNLVKIFTWLDERLKEGYGMSGLRHRFMNLTEEPDLENKRFYGIWGVNLKLFKKHNVAKMNDISTKEDFALMLNFLLAGVKILRSGHWIMGKASRPNDSGGCSTYRTLDRMNHDSLAFHEKYKKFTKLVKKKRKSWDGELQGEFYDTIIYFSKAYDYYLKMKSTKEKRKIF